MEHFNHDDCPQCGAKSIPYEGVPDQQLRECPKCEHIWWEDLSKPPKKAEDKNGASS